MTPSHFVTTDWLKERLGAPGIIVLDASWYLPAQGRNAEAEYQAAHIPGAIRFDIDAMSDETSPLPHMLPRPEVFSSRMRELGIGDGMHIIVYDGMGLFSAPRVWWMLRTFGVRDVQILEGGFPAWLAAGGPTEDGDGPPPRPAPFLGATGPWRRGRCRRCRSCPGARFGAGGGCPFRPALPWRGGRATPRRTSRPHAGRPQRPIIPRSRRTAG